MFLVNCYKYCICSKTYFRPVKLYYDNVQCVFSMENKILKLYYDLQNELNFTTGYTIDISQWYPHLFPVLFVVHVDRVNNL